MKPKSVNSIILLYGLVCGSLIVLYSILTFLTVGDFSKLTPQRFKLFEILGYLRYFMLMLTVFMAMRHVRKMTREYYTFGSLLKTGVLVTLVIAGIVAVMQYFYVYFNPDFFEKYASIYLRQMSETGSSEGELKLAREQMESYSVMKTPWANGLFYFFESAFIGNIAALAFAMVMKPRQTTTISGPG